MQKQNFYLYFVAKKLTKKKAIKLCAPYCEAIIQIVQDIFFII